MKILAVESSAQSSSCAVWEDGRISADMYTNVCLTHSQTLMPMMDEMLKITGISPADIDVFAVSSGPGSFTGIRIGIAAVKGMAFALDKLCVSVPTLETIAYGARLFDGIICAVMDARRQQVYNALFKCKGGKLDRIAEDRAISIDELGREIGDIGEPCVLVGDGAQLCYDQFGDLRGALLAPPNIRYQNAASVAEIAYNYYLAGKTVPAEKLLPVYLRLPQAQRELMEKKGGSK